MQKRNKTKVLRRSPDSGQAKECWLMLLPFLVFFTVFTVIPVLISLPIGFTDFDMINKPEFVGLSNYKTLFLSDKTFIHSIRVTIIFAIFTGPVSYVLCFLLAWLINELHPRLKTIFTLIFYAPSMANVYTIWQLIFSGDQYGYANSVLLDLGIITESKQWLTDSRYILAVVIIVQLWISLGAGFLALRAGFQNIDKSQYEAGAIEGIRNRWQELIYITIPAMGPQMMFAAVMQIVAAFTADIVGRNLVGFPSTDYAAHTIMTHAYDYGWVRYEMGYSSAICTVLFAVMYFANRIIRKVLAKYMD
ncbi:MAG: sugar ABC transporter permease [Oscillospiraceae bacterium]|nr:sugar ABC transporter permease [Oscillospiraceae bacterium]